MALKCKEGTGLGKRINKTVQTGEESINRTILLNGFTDENGLSHILRFSDYEKTENSK